MTEATEAIRTALAAQDVGTIRALHAQHKRLLFTYNPNRATAVERAFERVMQDADNVLYPRERCGQGRYTGRHTDDCWPRCSAVTD